MKKIPYVQQWIDRRDVEEVCLALRSDFLTQGPRVKDFEEMLASYCGAKYAVVVNSGTSALHIACIAAGLRKGDEAITTPITFVASANAVLYCEARPVFADISEDNILIDTDEIKKKISSKTKVIIPVDFAGHPADLEEIKVIAKKRKLIVIEDAAHALGAKYRVKNQKSRSKWTKIGSCKHSDMAILSFHAIKHITTGEGGAVLTNNKKFYEKLLMLRTHGITRNRSKYRVQNFESIGSWYYEMQDLGFNYRITDVQCALGMSQLHKSDSFLQKRKEIVLEYNRAFTQIEGIRVLREKSHVISAHHLYILQFDPKKFSASRKEFFNEYRREGILVNVHYNPVYLQPYYQKLGYKKGLCPKAEKYYQEAITLPLYPKMSDLDAKRVIQITCKIIKKFKK